MCLTKIPTHSIFKTTAGYIFSKYVYCVMVMRFLVGKNSALLSYLDGLCIAVTVFIY